MENSFTLSVSANWNWKYKDAFITLSSYSKSLCGFICKQRSSSSSSCSCRQANGATGHISLWRVDRNLASSCKPYGLGSDFELAQISLASAGMNQAVVSVTLRVAVPQLKREPYELRGCCFCKVQRLTQWWQCLWEIVPVQSKTLWQLFSNLSVCFSRWGAVMRHAVILRISLLRFQFQVRGKQSAGAAMTGRSPNVTGHHQLVSAVSFGGKGTLLPIGPLWTYRVTHPPVHTKYKREITSDIVTHFLWVVFPR